MRLLSDRFPLHHGHFALAVLVVLSGCSPIKTTLSDVSWCNHTDNITSYRGHLGKIRYPCLDNETAYAVQVTGEPRNLFRRNEDEVQEFTLAEAIQIALSHNEVIETSALGSVGSAAVLTNPRFASSVYDPAIQESGVLFGGGLGVEAALSRFDTQFTTSTVWGRSTATLIPRETAAFTSAISKQFATGGTVALSHDWNYLGTPVGVPFTSTYFGSLGLSVRQPLLAGAGVEFTRIAGPTNPVLGAITGVGQGVVIARINHDVSIADFEIAVRDAVRDIENTYWDLYFSYRSFDTAVVAYQSAQRTWREAWNRADVGALDPAEELQAKDRLFETKGQVEQTLNTIYKTESELRRLIGLPVNDGYILRPIDEPSIAEFIPDWEASLRQALSLRTELRAQKWRIKSVQLQLKAARSLLRPSLNLVGSFAVNGLGDRLMDDRIISPATGLPIQSGFGSMPHANLETWTAGVEMTVPVGFRSARSQVRNLELQLAKATAVLAAQERNIAHDIATAVHDVTAAYAVAQSNLNRLKAALDRVERLEDKRDVGILTLDLVLRAQASVAAAESAYYQQLVNYNKALVSMQLASGELLAHNGVLLSEGHWCADAYCDAQIRARERTYADPNPHLHTEPPEFVSPGPTGTIERRVSVQPFRDSPGNVLAVPTIEPSAEIDEFEYGRPYDSGDPEPLESEIGGS